SPLRGGIIRVKQQGEDLDSDHPGLVEDLQCVKVRAEKVKPAIRGNSLICWRTLGALTDYKAKNHYV
ncbi:MAG TPA: hypothetical protein VE134_00660, partial [Methanomicrobiales archaeon]|nr:hypothetical protein [Methanomicrobiales archaeon]